MMTSLDQRAVSACPRCGTVRKVYKCECEAPGRINPVVMPEAVAARLRELHAKVYPPLRLTATPAGVTVWVEDVDGGRVQMRPVVPRENLDAVRSNGWTVLTRSGWDTVRSCVDSYFRALEGTRKPLPQSVDRGALDEGEKS